MLGRIEVRLRRLRRSMSRSHWVARALRLPAGVLTRPGLVIVQVDGLSRRELQRAIDNGEMTFLKRLLNREHYQLHAHYPGLPTSTPGVQGELFTALAISFQHLDF